MDRQLAVATRDALRVPTAGQNQQRPGGLAPTPEQRRSAGQLAFLPAGASAAHRGAEHAAHRAAALGGPCAATHQQALRGPQQATPDAVGAVRQRAEDGVGVLACCRFSSAEKY